MVDILDYDNIDKFDYDGHINNFIDSQNDINLDYDEDSLIIEDQIEEDRIEEDQIVEDQIEVDQFEEDKVEEDKVVEIVEEGEKNENISEILRNIIHDNNDSNDILRDCTISMNNIIDTPINDYTITESYLFLIFIIMFIGCIAFIITKGVPKWK